MNPFGIMWDVKTLTKELHEVYHSLMMLFLSGGFQ